MAESLKDELCSICTKKIRSVRYPDINTPLKDFWDFRNDYMVERCIYNFIKDSWLHTVRFEIRKSKSWVSYALLFFLFFLGVFSGPTSPEKLTALLLILAFYLLVEYLVKYLVRKFVPTLALICGYCRLTLESLNEFHTIETWKWFYWDWFDSKTKVLNKPLTKAFKNIDSLREKIATQKKLIQDVIKEAWEKQDSAHRKKMKQKAEERKERKKEREKEREKRDKERRTLKTKIVKLLKEKAVKMPASDIDAFLKHQNVAEIKELCEEMYINGEISRTTNYRYFILTEEKKKPKPKKASAPKTEKVDIEKELEILKGLLDKGLITQEMYDAKAKELLGV